MSEIRKVHHYHTKTPNNNPLATNMVDGEIAINMAADSEKLYIKNTNDEVVEFLPAKKTEELLNGKQDEITDLATIRSGAAKGATALQSVPAEYITETELNAKGYLTEHQDISGKVDKVSGKGLSTNDYTTAEKNKLAGIASGAEVNVQSDWNETNTSSDAYIKNKPTIPTAVTETTVSNWGFTKNTGTYSKPSDGIPKSDLSSTVQTSLNKADTALQSYTEQYKGTVTSVRVSGANGLTGSGTVTSSGTITISGVTATSGATGVSKLVTGDLKNKTYNNGEAAAAAHTHSQYLTGYTEQYKGTITGVSVNGSSVSTSGLANIPSASTSVYGVTKLTTSTSSTSTTLAATASAVKSAYDLANGKQDKLTSGTNIKTVNGQSLLGSGNITIEGGNSDANIQAVDTGDVLDDVNIEYCTKSYIDGLVGDINSVLESIINGGGN